MTTHSHQRICVLGAGIVGLTTAWTLANLGHSVTVIDRDGPGEGTTRANGAQLSYAHVQPLANPSVWKQLPSLLTQADSPLRWELQADTAQWGWLAQFLLACRQGRTDCTTRELLTLAAESRQGYDALMAGTDIACEFNDHGKLVLYPDKASLKAAERQMGLQRALGAPHQRLLSAAEAMDTEPALRHSSATFAGALYTPSECAVDPHLLCVGLAERLVQRGVRVLGSTSVQGWRVSGGRVCAVQTSTGEVEADAFVVALGLGSRSVLKPLGLRLPLYPLKGYSVTVDLNGPDEQAPRVSVTDAARRVVFARLGNRLRVAGMVELVGECLDIAPARIQQLQSCGASWWPQAADWRQAAQASPWAGLRPATPTGLPLLGRWPGAPDNLLLNTGHGPLGLTLAFGSAQRLARLLA
jgi:D-amino-acid dehydrogenase